MNDIFPSRDQLNMLAHSINQATNNVKPDTFDPMFYMGVLHAYLYLCKIECVDKGKMSQQTFNTIKTSLQAIADWFIVDLDIETFTTKAEV